MNEGKEMYWQEVMQGWDISKYDGNTPWDDVLLPGASKVEKVAASAAEKMLRAYLKCECQQQEVSQVVAAIIELLKFNEWITYRDSADCDYYDNAAIYCVFSQLCLKVTNFSKKREIERLKNLYQSSAQVKKWFDEFHGGGMPWCETWAQGHDQMMFEFTGKTREQIHEEYAKAAENWRQNQKEAA